MSNAISYNVFFSSKVRLYKLVLSTYHQTAYVTSRQNSVNNDSQPLKPTKYFLHQLQDFYILFFKTNTNNICFHKATCTCTIHS